MVSLTVITPMYNEEGVISDTVKELRDTVSKDFEKFELIFVDDGSVDDTYNVVDSFAKKDKRIKVFRHRSNFGRGAALRTGFRHAAGEVVVTIDADLSYSPSYIPLLIQKMDDSGADVVLGSTFMNGARMINVPLFRALLSKIGNKVLTFSIDKKLTVITCVFRAYKKEVIDSLDIEADDKTVHLEILSKVLDMGYKVEEVPTSLKWRKFRADKNKEKKRKSKFKIGSVFTHALFTFSEKPFLLLGSIAFLMIVFGLGIGGFIVYSWLADPHGTGKSALLILMLVLLVGGLQVLFFNFLAVQNRNVVKRMNRLQRDVLLKGKGSKDK
ncbi:MAG: glycosyltransferase family 2 protein [Candidatus Woesearchaeota archaeon]|nr:glycosyltransferase family 2 protein [Candidatus Woesearchaeota archaeon]